jgi:hypothetical protein
MTDASTKKWYQSKTIWGILIAALGFVLTNVLKVPDTTLPENADFNQLKAYADSVKAADGNISIIISEVLSIIGTVVAIYGRIKAGEKIAK